MKKFIKNESGQSMVELAIVLPVLLIVLCGILDFGWIFANQYKVENAAFSGARYAAIYAPDCAESEQDTLIENTKGRVKENLYKEGKGAETTVTIDSDKVKVEVHYPVKILTFVAQMFYGDYYKASSVSVSSI